MASKAACRDEPRQQHPRVQFGVCSVLRRCSFGSAPGLSLPASPLALCVCWQQGWPFIAVLLRPTAERERWGGDRSLRSHRFLGPGRETYPRCWLGSAKVGLHWLGHLPSCSGTHLALASSKSSRVRATSGPNGIWRTVSAKSGMASTNFGRTRPKSGLF